VREPTHSFQSRCGRRGRFPLSFGALLIVGVVLAVLATPRIVAAQDTFSASGTTQARLLDTQDALNSSATAPTPYRVFNLPASRADYSAAPSPAMVRTVSDWELNRVAQAQPAPEAVPPATPSAAAPATGTNQGLPQPDAVPPVESSPFVNGMSRFPTLALPPGLATPAPTPQVEAKFDNFVAQEVSPDNTLQIVVGRAKVLVFREPPRRVYIPREDIAEYQVITPTQLAVVGKKVGTSMLNLWFADPAAPNDQTKDHLLSYLIVVLPDPEAALLERKRLEAEVKAYEASLKVLAQEIKRAFPDSAVNLSMVGEKVVVSGEVKDMVEAAQILTIVNEHTPINARSSVPPQDLRIQFIPGLGDQAAAVAAIRNLLQGNPNLVNQLQVPGEQQVMLMVTVAEVNRAALRSIGADFSITKGKFAFAQVSGNLFTTPNQTSTGVVASGIAGLGGNLPTSIDNGSLLLAINALRTQNFSRTLAEPNLTTLNAKPASFHAGGSFPVPQTNVTSAGAALATSVVYVPFGVDLQFTPNITDRDRIRLAVQASVSTRSSTTTAVSGSEVPSELDDRTFQTTVEMREGQTLAVAGLIDTNFGGTSRRVPFWGDLPIIGRLGGFDQLTSGEQEVIVLVTPVLVHPLDRCKTPNVPGSDIFEPGDVEFYLGGHLEGTRSEDFRASVRTDFARQAAYLDCENTYIIGPKGPTYGCCACGPCGTCGKGNMPTPAPAMAAPLMPAPPMPPAALPSQLPNGGESIITPPAR
jgi:pilus assembly protein CpaC